MKIYAPVKNVTGTYASVFFAQGVAECNDPVLLEWFKDHGFTLEHEIVSLSERIGEEPPKEREKPIKENGEPDFDAMTAYELREWLMEHGYKVRNTRNKEKLMELMRG